MVNTLLLAIPLGAKQEAYGWNLLITTTCIFKNKLQKLISLALNEIMELDQMLLKDIEKPRAASLNVSHDSVKTAANGIETGVFWYFCGFLCFILCCWQIYFLATQTVDTIIYSFYAICIPFVLSPAIIYIYFQKRKKYLTFEQILFSFAWLLLFVTAGIPHIFE